MINIHLTYGRQDHETVVALPPDGGGAWLEQATPAILLDYLNSLIPIDQHFLEEGRYTAVTLSGSIKARMEEVMRTQREFRLREAHLREVEEHPERFLEAWHADELPRLEAPGATEFIQIFSPHEPPLIIHFIPEALGPLAAGWYGLPPSFGRRTMARLFRSLGPRFQEGATTVARDSGCSSLSDDPFIDLALE